MKKSAWLVVFSALAVAPVSFGSTFTGCTSSGAISDGGNGYFVQGTCNLYREPAAYPYDATPFLSSANSLPGDSPYTAENYFTAGYVVFTTNPTEVADQTALTPADWEDVIFFNNNVAAGTASSQFTLEWPGGAGPNALPTTTTVNNFTVDSNPGDGEDFILATGTGFNQLVETNVTFNVFDTLPTTTPEPSSFLMLAGGALGMWAFRRRRA